MYSRKLNKHFHRTTTGYLFDDDTEYTLAEIGILNEKDNQGKSLLSADSLLSIHNAKNIFRGEITSINEPNNEWYR